MLVNLDFVRQNNQNSVVSSDETWKWKLHIKVSRTGSGWLNNPLKDTKKQIKERNRVMSRVRYTAEPINN